MGAVEKFHISETKGNTSVRDRSISHRLIPRASKSTYALCSDLLYYHRSTERNDQNKEVKLGSRMIGGNYLVRFKGYSVYSDQWGGESLALSNIQGIGDSILQMSSHGLVSLALFLCVGVLYDRNKTRLVRYYGGSVSTMPNLPTIFFSSTLANMSSPSTSSFIGEFLILVGAFRRNRLVSILAALGMILGTAYSF
ncbi:hypothetical protein M9H77_02892 [Catharanthus roseus]|uniref:Uncharacterized protein n=1 Tax=Catharanthus roseus TaxID=4058 RepID=A0ACC0C9M9_CATRO|nr:hypothetical protein M9H77_02892 [Catharanthus roseus]